MSIASQIKKIAHPDIFEKDDNENPRAGIFVGRPFYLDFERCNVLVADKWKSAAKGIPQGCLLLAYYENEVDVSEAILLRVLKPCSLPNDSNVVTSMVEYYKDNIKTTGPENNLDTFTKYEFGFSGLECRVIGTFYKDEQDNIKFGADVENFYSAHNYRIFKPNPNILRHIVNYEADKKSGAAKIKIGHVRYSSSKRFQEEDIQVPVYVTPSDFLGKRTALFGMTRTGKSNTVKKIIQATVSMNDKAPLNLKSKPPKNIEDLLDPLTNDGMPKYPAGQIVFDVNGEYANPNLQDAGTSISEIYEDKTIRYSVVKKDGFRVMKVNFYKDIQTGFQLIANSMSEDNSIYVQSYLSIDMLEPDADNKFGSEWTRYNRMIAAHLCCLYMAGFKAPEDFKVTFKTNKELNALISEGKLDPSKGISLKEACTWFSEAWDLYKGTHQFFEDYKKKEGESYFDEDIKSVLVMLTKKQERSGMAIAGYSKLRPITEQHTDVSDESFSVDIVNFLRDGKIVIVDLSQGDKSIQDMYSEMICRKIFASSMHKFTANQPNNFIQFYFEEAHNLFPKKEDKDYTGIYSKIAKEGAKLNIGMIYATQEASSISGNILKNTQNWFIAHLNNSDETKEIRKFYDFEDFSNGLIRFSADNDRGFVRMKSYSNPFVIPVQIALFEKAPKE